MGEYYTQIHMGGQPVRVQVDTGSSTLALPLAECDRCLPSDQRYNPRLSQSGKSRWISCRNKLCRRDICRQHACKICSAEDACCADENPTACGFKMEYGDGSGARGALMVDVMAWGNISAPVVFGGILHDTQDFERSAVDGILGMAYESLACNPTCVEPPFQQLVKAGVVENSFAICLTPQGGRLVLGEFDPTLARTELKYVSMSLTDPPTYYTVTVSSDVSVGERTVSLPGLKAGIIDSGTTLVVVSKDTFKHLLHHLQTNYCHIPGLCHKEKTWFKPSACVIMSDDILELLPTLKFHLGEHKEYTLELRATDYMLRLEKPGHRDYRCVGIMSMGRMQNGTDIIFGNTMMTRYVTHFDRENKRIGFAEAAKGCGITSECRSYTQCGECASSKRCSFNLREGRCDRMRQGLGVIPYPECSGRLCLCGLGAQSGLFFGVVTGLIISAGILGAIFCIGLLYGKWGVQGIGRGGDRAPVYSIAEGEEEGTDELDDWEAGDGWEAGEDVETFKRYARVPTE